MSQLKIDAIAAKFAALYDKVVVYGGLQGLLYETKTTCTMDSIKVLPLDGASSSSVYTYSHSGASTADSLPAETSLVITLRTGLRGPRHRGRIYLPPWTESSCNADGTANAADLANKLTVLGLFQTDIETSPSTWEVVVASYKYADWNLVTQFTSNGDFDVQRRRKS